MARTVIPAAGRRPGSIHVWNGVPLRGLAAGEKMMKLQTARRRAACQRAIPLNADCDAAIRVRCICRRSIYSFPSIQSTVIPDANPGRSANSYSMARATIIIAVDSSDEVAAFGSWLERWRSRLTFISDDRGCGCCVRIMDVEGAQEAVDDIPESLWASNERSP